MIIYEDFPQASPEWHRIRAGRPTASEFHRIIKPNGKTDKKAWHDYAVELIAETIRPDDAAWQGNRHTERGNDLEPEARGWFAHNRLKTVHEVAFVTREDGIVGCSPDGLLQDSSGNWEAGVEIKCPAPKKHAAIVLRGELPDEYKVQVHGGMAVTGLNRWWFVSYCPGFRPFVLQVERDAFTDQVSEALNSFLLFYHEARQEFVPQLVAKK